jgi:hypothetical protein
MLYVKELFELADFLKAVGGMAGDAAPEDSADLGEGGVEVECGRSVEVFRVEPADPPRLWGLDSHSRAMRLEGVDVHFSPGAAVGSGAVLVPGLAGVKWIAVRFRYRLGGEAPESPALYLRSAYLGRPFDSTFNEDALRDELRLHVENSIIRALEWDGVLLVDGPIFLTPRVLAMGDNPYSALYLGLIRDRVSAIGGRRALGVTKRIGVSRYLRRCLSPDVDVDDDTLARRAAKGIEGDVAVGPLRIRAGGREKVCWYLVARLGRQTHVLRVEGLDEELARRAVEWLPKVLGPDGVPTPIAIADKLSRRLSAAAYSLFWRMSPLDLTYEGLEELERAHRELESP